jgi:Methylamine utilisation protein MauE
MDGFKYLVDALGSLLGTVTSDPVPLMLIFALALLFVAAGVYKLAHPMVGATTAANFRVVARPRLAVGYALGVAETGIGVLLVWPESGTARLGCALAGAMSAGYSAVIFRSLARGDQFPCNCLPVVSGDISIVSGLRSLAMLLAAAVAAFGVTSSNTGTGSSYTALGGAACLLGMPMATFAAAKSYRIYRQMIRDTDWTWVLAARAGQVVTAHGKAGRTP